MESILVEIRRITVTYPPTLQRLPNRAPDPAHHRFSHLSRWCRSMHRCHHLLCSLGGCWSWPAVAPGIWREHVALFCQFCCCEVRSGHVGKHGCIADGDRDRDGRGPCYRYQFCGLVCKGATEGCYRCCPSEDAASDESGAVAEDRIRIRGAIKGSNLPIIVL